MSTYTLTELQYSDDRKGPWKLYVYKADGYHNGGVWFRAKPEYPREEITSEKALEFTKSAMRKKHEVRICDGGDMLVLHAKDGKTLYPADPKAFWQMAMTV